MTFYAYLFVAFVGLAFVYAFNRAYLATGIPLERYRAVRDLGVTHYIIVIDKHFLFGFYIRRFDVVRNKDNRAQTARYDTLAEAITAMDELRKNQGAQP